MQKKNLKCREAMIHINSVEDLNTVRKINQDLFQTVILILNEDLLFDNIPFEPIDASKMNVIIKGNNHFILDLYINKKDKMEVGLFSRTKDFKIYNIRYFTHTTIGASCTGGLVGTVDGTAIVHNVCTNGIVQGESHCGGLFGTTKNLLLDCNPKIVETVIAKDIVGGVVGTSDKIINNNTNVYSSTTTVTGKVHGVIAGYNSEKMKEKINQMLEDTFPYLKKNRKR